MLISEPVYLNPIPAMRIFGTTKSVSSSFKTGFRYYKKLMTTQITLFSEKNYIFYV